MRRNGSQTSKITQFLAVLTNRLSHWEECRRVTFFADISRETEGETDGLRTKSK